jgi:hypothetical protein
MMFGSRSKAKLQLSKICVAFGVGHFQNDTENHFFNGNATEDICYVQKYVLSIKSPLPHVLMATRSPC